MRLTPVHPSLEQWPATRWQSPARRQWALSFSAHLQHVPLIKVFRFLQGRREKPWVPLAWGWARLSLSHAQHGPSYSQRWSSGYSGFQRGCTSSSRPGAGFRGSLRAGGLGDWREERWGSRRQRDPHISGLLGSTVVLPDPMEIWKGLASLKGPGELGGGWEMGWWWGVWRSPRRADTLFWCRTSMTNKSTYASFSGTQDQ